MTWTPEVPTITRSKGRDGKESFCIVVRNDVDIDLMLRMAGLSTTGIHEQNNEYLRGVYRIIKRH
ncbi:hypothetical protein JJB07_14770 [Tumebacillus sp. ITR2]|uniref:Uncharacterized protein n=1 Tax=Tumebacillus amylolyticus TaxID=2801339 RepID=A0ABS1JCA2_9BACL|nr:hypothetical protein [Tumebacillus amylolyticus]MBL0387901.1 hypothetical protein [Tumebacillus amylolyticus]